MGAAIKPIRTRGRTKLPSKSERRYESPLDRARPSEVIWQQVANLFEAARVYDDQSFVYAIGEDQDGPIKIGVAKDPIARIRSMQTGNSRRLRIEYVLVGDRSVERVLHELWEPWAIISPAKAGKVNAAPGTEWFRSEVRDQLLPILATAAARQVDHLWGNFGEATMADMETLVRKAHIDHGFVATGRDEIRLLDTVGGYAIPRPSVL